MKLVPDTLLPQNERAGELRNAQSDLGLRGKAFAAALGLHPVTLSKMQRGRMPVSNRTLCQVNTLVDAMLFRRLRSIFRDSDLIARRVTSEAAGSEPGCSITQDERTLLVFSHCFGVLWEAAFRGDADSYRRALVSIGAYAGPRDAPSRVQPATPRRKKS